MDKAAPAPDKPLYCFAECTESSLLGTESFLLGTDSLLLGTDSLLLGTDSVLLVRKNARPDKHSG